MAHIQCVSTKLALERLNSAENMFSLPLSGPGALWKQQLQRESSNATQQALQHMSPKLFLIQKQQKQMKAELAASRQLHIQHQAEYAAGSLGAHCLHETLTQNIQRLSLGGSQSSLPRTSSNIAAEYPLLHSLATQGSLTAPQLLAAKY